MSEAAPANVRVLVRVRPFNDREAKINQTSVLEIENGGASAIDFGDGDDGGGATISIVNPSAGAGGYGSGYESVASTATAQSRTFGYDAAFGPRSRQIEIFDSIRGIVDAVCAGYNGTIVAYGQTGSGKTYTVFGDEGLRDNNDAGLVQRSLRSIFRKIAEQSLQNAEQESLLGPAAAGAATAGSVRTSAKASFFEIYNERVYDLLSPNAAEEDGKGLPVREDAAKGVYVEGLIEREVANTMDAMDVLRCGISNRSVASTKMNRVSSRSHALFVLTVRSELFSENGTSKVRTSKFTLCDLAGSERQKATATDGERLKEAGMINNSLLCLGQVINSLADRERGRQQNHVPFRDTKLTFLLKDSFGGNSKTCLVATVTPSAASLTETVSTLKFAQRAKLIENAAVRNENTHGSVAALRAEIARLRAALEAKNDPMPLDRAAADPGLPPLAPADPADLVTASALRNQNAALQAENTRLRAALETKNDPTPSNRAAADPGLSPLAPANPANVVTASALRSQNSKLSKKRKVLKDVTNQRETKVDSLKRKPQQETLLRKSKGRRIKNDMSSDQAAADLGLPPLAPTDPANVVTVSALRSQNSKLSKKVKVLKDVTNQREIQVDSLKRKLQQETLLRKCKERRITYLSGKGKTSGAGTDDEIEALQKEVAILREQLEAQPAETIEWMLKYKAERAKVEEMKANATNAFGSSEKSEMEASLVALLDERDGLRLKVEDMTTGRNSEIDSIVNDVNKLENSNKALQCQLEKKKLVIAANEDKIQSNKAQINEMQESLTSTIGCLESTQKELVAEKEKVVELQASVDSIRAEVNEANAAIIEHQGKVAVSKEELRKTTDSYTESTAALDTKIAELQRDLDAAMGSNESLMKKLEAALDDLEAKKAQLESLEQAKSEALEKLGASQEKNNADLESFKLQEEAMRAEVMRAEETIESLFAERTQATESLESATAENATLSGVVEALKLERDALKQRVESLDKLHDHVASLEDEVTFMAIEREQVEKQLQFTQADLERTVRLEAQSRDTETSARDDELALCDEIICSLSGEKSKAQEELNKVSQQLFDHRMASEETIAILQTNLDELTSRANSLEDDLNKTKNTVKSLQNEKVETVELLEKVTAQNNLLAEKVVALRSQRDELHEDSLALDTKVTELQMDLAIVTDKNESQAEKLKSSSDELEATKTRLESLEHAKSEALAQLELAQAKSTADLELFKLHEDTLKAEVKKGGETAGLLRGKMKDAEDESKKMAIKITELRACLDSATNEKDALLHKFKDVSGELEAKETQLAGLQQENSEALTQLQLARERSAADHESFRLKEEELRADVAKGEEKVASFKEKVDAAEDEWKKMTQAHEESITTLNDNNVQLQKGLDNAIAENELLAKSLEDAFDDLETKKTQLESLERDNSEALTQLQLAQERNVADHESFRLKEEELRADVAKGEEKVASFRQKVNAAEEELKKMAQKHEESITALNDKNEKLQKGLDNAITENELLAKNLKDASSDLETKKTQLESLERDNSEALTQLQLAQVRRVADQESFRLKEDERVDVAKGEAVVASFQGKVNAAEEELKKTTQKHEKSITTLNGGIGEDGITHATMDSGISKFNATTNPPANQTNQPIRNDDIDSNSIDATLWETLDDYDSEIRNKALKLL